MMIIKIKINNVTWKHMHKHHLYLAREYAFNSNTGCSTRTVQDENYQQWIFHAGSSAPQKNVSQR